MIEKSLETPAPLGPHERSLSDPHLCIETAGGTALILYCPRTSCGAVYDIEARMWYMNCPIAFDEFVNNVNDAGLTIGDEAGREVWMQRLREVILAETPMVAANDPDAGQP